jgi:hypothetical protein
MYIFAKSSSPMGNNIDTSTYLPVSLAFYTASTLLFATSFVVSARIAWRTTISFGAPLLFATGVCTLIHGAALADASVIELMTEANLSCFSHWSYFLLGPMAYVLNVGNDTYPAFFSLAVVSACGLFYVFGQYGIYLDAATGAWESQDLDGGGTLAAYPIGALPFLYALLVAVCPARSAGAPPLGPRDGVFCLSVFTPILYNGMRAFLPTLAGERYALFDASVVFDGALLYVSIALLCAGANASRVFNAVIGVSCAAKVVLGIAAA